MTKPSLHHDSLIHFAIIISLLFLAKDQFDVLAEETEHLSTSYALFNFFPRVREIWLVHVTTFTDN